MPSFAWTVTASSKGTRRKDGVLLLFHHRAGPLTSCYLEPLEWHTLFLVGADKVSSPGQRLRSDERFHAQYQSRLIYFFDICHEEWLSCTVLRIPPHLLGLGHLIFARKESFDESVVNQKLLTWPPHHLLHQLAISIFVILVYRVIYRSEQWAHYMSTMTM